MHSGAINREYKFKFYLNANHYIIIDGKEGEQHPHTWEFMVHIRMNGELVRMESSETPTRSYVINFEHNEDYLESVRRNSDRQMSEIIDEVLDRVIE